RVAHFRLAEGLERLLRRHAKLKLRPTLLEVRLDLWVVLRLRGLVPRSAAHAGVAGILAVVGDLDGRPVAENRAARHRSLRRLAELLQHQRRIVHRAVGAHYDAVQPLRTGLDERAVRGRVLAGHVQTGCVPETQVLAVAASLLDDV